MPVTFMSFGEMTADSPPRCRSLISRMRTRMSASNTSNSSWLISPSSTRICASSRRSRNTVSSFISVSTAAATLSSTKRTPEMMSESMMSIAVGLVRALQLEADVDEVVGRPGAGVLERQLVVLLADFLDPSVERQLHLARHEERGVHDHAI